MGCFLSSGCRNLDTKLDDASVPSLLIDLVEYAAPNGARVVLETKPRLEGEL